MSEQFLNGTSAKYRQYSAIEIESRRKITVENYVNREKRNELQYRIK